MRIKPCEQCGKEIKMRPCDEGRKKYCSRECHAHSRTKYHAFPCNSCGKEVVRTNYQAFRHNKHFCNDACKDEYKKKTRDLVLYRRKKGYLQSLQRGTISPRKIRQVVFSVKPKKCEICNLIENECCFDIHHKDKNPLNNEISNLVVLCCFCHRKLHKNLIGLDSIKTNIVEQAQEILKEA